MRCGFTCFGETTETKSQKPDAPPSFKICIIVGAWGRVWLLRFVFLCFQEPTENQIAKKQTHPLSPLDTHPPIHRSTAPPIHPSIHRSMHPSIHPSGDPPTKGGGVVLPRRPQKMKGTGGRVVLQRRLRNINMCGTFIRTCMNRHRFRRSRDKNYRQCIQACRLYSTVFSHAVDFVHHATNVYIGLIPADPICAEIGFQLYRQN